MQIISKNQKETNTYEIEFSLNADEFEAGLEATYQKKKKNIAVPGFRKGKATRKLIETHYGEAVFFEDTINELYNKNIAKVIDDSELDIVDINNTEVTSVKKDEGVAYKFVATVKPEVEVSDYKGIKLTKKIREISDEDVMNEIKAVQDKNARIITVDDRAAQNGDITVIDFEGFKDGVAFEGGKGENYSLELGSNSFIPGFEEQVVGHKTGEEFDINVTFPADYQSEDLKGKEVVFKIKLHEIKAKELAESDDEFVKDVSEFDTLDEYKADVKKKLEEHEDSHAEGHLEVDLTEEILKNFKADVPEVLYDNRVEDLIRDWSQRNRISIDDYLKYTNSKLEDFKENFKEPAKKQVDLRLALEKIAKLENITVSDEEIEEEFKKLSEQYKMEIDRIKAIIPNDSLKNDLVAEKTLKFVRDNAEITEEVTTEACEHHHH